MSNKQEIRDIEDYIQSADERRRRSEQTHKIISTKKKRANQNETDLKAKTATPVAKSNVNERHVIKTGTENFQEDFAASTLNSSALHYKICTESSQCESDSKISSSTPATIEICASETVTNDSKDSRVVDSIDNLPLMSSGNESSCREESDCAQRNAKKTRRSKKNRKDEDVTSPNHFRKLCKGPWMNFKPHAGMKTRSAKRDTSSSGIDSRGAGKKRKVEPMGEGFSNSLHSEIIAAYEDIEGEHNMPNESTSLLGSNNPFDAAVSSKGAGYKSGTDDEYSVMLTAQQLDDNVDLNPSMHGYDSPCSCVVNFIIFLSIWSCFLYVFLTCCRGKDEDGKSKNYESEGAMNWIFIWLGIFSTLFIGGWVFVYRRKWRADAKIAELEQLQIAQRIEKARTGQ